MPNDCCFVFDADSFKFQVFCGWQEHQIGVQERGVVVLDVSVPFYVLFMRVVFIILRDVNFCFVEWCRYHLNDPEKTIEDTQILLLIFWYCGAKLPSCSSRKLSCNTSRGHFSVQIDNYMCNHVVITYVQHHHMSHTALSVVYLYSISASNLLRILPAIL
jgi:hypothetical protein